MNLLKFAGINYNDQKKEIFIGPEEEKKAFVFLKKHKMNPEDFLIGISVTAGNIFKEWSLDKFSQLADMMIENLDCLGAMVIIEAQHLCMIMRGVKKPGSKIVTSAMRGIFLKDARTRSEALSLIRQQT